MTDSPRLPSNQTFGWFFATVFLFAALWYHISFDGLAVALSLAAVSVLLALLASAAPQVLAPLNRCWYQLGLLLGKLVNPLVLAVLFYLLLTPVALLGRLFGRDELKLKKRSTPSYWVERAGTTPTPESFRKPY